MAPRPRRRRTTTTWDNEEAHPHQTEEADQQEIMDQVEGTDQQETQDQVEGMDQRQEIVHQKADLQDPTGEPRG